VLRRERAVDARDVSRHDEVDVFVTSGFTAEQCIDAPASVHRRVDPATKKDSEELKNAFGSHRSTLWCGLTWALSRTAEFAASAAAASSAAYHV